MSTLLCPWCNQCMAGTHEWHCPLMQPQQPTMNTGELDGQNLIEMNNLAVGFAAQPKDSAGEGR